MSNTMADLLVTVEDTVTDKQQCDQADDQKTAFFKDGAAVPCNSPVDGWGWEDASEAASSPVSVSVVSPTPEQPKTIQIGRLFSPVAMASSDRLLASAFAQQTGRFWTGIVAIHDVSGDVPLLESSFALSSTASCLAFSDSSARSLVVGLDDGSLAQMALPNGSSTLANCEHDSPIAALAISPGGTRAFSCDLDGCVCVWDPMVALVNITRRPSITPQASDSLVTAHPLLERRFASAGINTLRLWQEEEVKSVTLASSARISCINWAEENVVLIGRTDGTLQAVDIRQCEKPLWSHGGGSRGREVLGVCRTASGAVVSISANNCMWVLKSDPAIDGDSETWGLSGGSVWDAHCQDKIVTAMVPLTSSNKAVVACCRDQTWWRWQDGSDSVECLPMFTNTEQ